MAESNTNPMAKPIYAEIRIKNFTASDVQNMESYIRDMLHQGFEITHVVPWTDYAPVAPDDRVQRCTTKMQVHARRKA